MHAVKLLHKSMKLTRRKSKVECYIRVSTPEKAEVCILHSFKIPGNV